LKCEIVLTRSAGAFSRIVYDTPVFVSHTADLLKVARVARHYDEIMGDSDGRNPPVVCPNALC
jgi:hypothetical protein